MRKRRSISGSIRINFRHQQELNPSETTVLRKPVRGSDVPLFPGRNSLGIEIKDQYNYCINLAAYKPLTAPLLDTEQKKEVKKEEKKAIMALKRLKKKKKDYSQTWKDNFKRYYHEEKQDWIEYDETDPSDDSWSRHPLLQKSLRMQLAAEDYLKVAEETLAALKDIRLALINILRPLILGHGLLTKDWIERGRAVVKNRLAAAQIQVDTILEQEWQQIDPHLRDFDQNWRDPRHLKEKDVAPSYIGSTNTGHKSVTKAYIQFNPDDFDVDGQLVAPALYMDLIQFKLPASKNRFFVREIKKPLRQMIDQTKFPKVPKYLPQDFKDAIEAQDRQRTPLTRAEIKRLDDLLKLVSYLFEYVVRVEDRLTSEVEGIEKDYEDPFDLAIVFV